MNKQELINALANNTGLTKSKALTVIESLADIVLQELGTGGSIRLRDIGVLESKTRAARTARNPATGEPVDLPERAVPAFRASALLKAAVSKQEQG
jgi:DNA-binding protein HU-beta